jgi:serine/threonine-protein kinase RsbW
LDKTYTKIFPSNPDLLPEIESFVNKIVSKTDLSSQKIINMEMALAEATANSILHGNKSDPNKNIEIIVIVSSQKIVIKIKDEGKGFIVKDVPDPTKDENMLKGSGRGLHIMKALVDNLEYNFTESGTETIITINRISSKEK